MSDNFHDERNKYYTLKIRALIKTMPPACSEFMRGIEPNTSVMTRYNYALDLKLFLEFLLSTELAGDAGSIADIDYLLLESVTADHIERFLEYITYYERTRPDGTLDGVAERMNSNGECGKTRKLSAIRAFYKYLYRKGRISTNAPALIDTIKIHDKPIVRLDPDEIYRILHAAESGEGLSKRQKAYHQITSARDTAIITLFLGTGMRISELAGINIDDVNFMTNEVRVTRKGGNQDILVFGQEVRTALLNYIVHRETVQPAPDNESALFLSMQKKRMSIRAIEKLVQKYARLAVPLKQISPHKLRSTYGTMLYRETGDIYLVADVLGHKDVNTTRKHYAAIEQDRRRIAAEVIRLRDEHEPAANPSTLDAE